MKVALALLADFALAHGDSKLYVTGGGIRTLDFPAYPAIQERLALALGLEPGADDKNVNHSIRIEVIGPTAHPIIEANEVAFTIQPEANEAGPRYSHFVYNMGPITFPTEGDYSFGITIDGTRLMEVPLHLGASGGPVPAEIQAAIRVQQGYDAYGSGDIETALQIFASATVEFPSYPSAFNNLGFVMLTKGAADAQEAIDAFVTARELGYRNTEITNANIGCANYLLGKYGLALELFRQCLNQYGLHTDSVLLGLNDKIAAPVALGSAAEYVALMNLNAGWSAYRSGERVAAKRHVQGVAASELALRQDGGGLHVNDSMLALEVALDHVDR